MKTPIKTPPEGCCDLEHHEREATTLAETLQARATQWLQRDGRIDVATAKELALVSLKARKIASDLAARRAEIVEFYDAMEHEKQMSGINGARPRERKPLRRSA